MNCSWCKPCSASFCDCGNCNDHECEVCWRAEDLHKPKPLPKKEPREWTDEESEGAGGDR